MQKIFTALYETLDEAISTCEAKYLSLSGGLDSTILAFYLKNKKINGISVITKDFVATDLTYCQLVAKKFEIPLNLISIETEDLLSAIEETVKILKIFNDIEIRNSVVMYLVLSALKEKGESKVITGDGADELFAGYNFFLKKNEKQLENDLKRIWSLMHFPTKKIGESLGISVESPFLMENMVKFAKSIPVNLKVKEENGEKFGKWILRKAFEKKIPQTIAWRKKSPMQDGAGTTALTNLFEILITDDVFKKRVKELQKTDKVLIKSKESLHYYDIYKKYCLPPYKLHSSSTKCPNCQFSVESNTKFCRMCGSYPI